MIFLKTALSAAAIALFIGTASFAQGGNPVPGERVDANGMPTTRSTPAEQAQTAEINKQVGARNAAVDAKAAGADEKAAADNAQYQGQQRQYQDQLQQNQAQQRDYEDRTAAYDSLADPLCLRAGRLSSRCLAGPLCEVGDRGPRCEADR